MISGFHRPNEELLVRVWPNVLEPRGSDVDLQTIWFAARPVPSCRMSYTVCVWGGFGNPDFYSEP